MEWITVDELESHILEYGKYSYDAIIVECMDEAFHIVYNHEDIPTNNVRFVSIVVRKEWDHD